MKLKNLCLLIAGITLLAGTSRVRAQYFTSGDLVVSVYGSTTGTNVITDGATPITLQEYALTTATSANLVLTDVLPTTGVNGNVGIQGEDGSSSEGTLQLSGNGDYLTIGGYDGNAANNGIQAASNNANGTSFAYGTVWSGTTIALGQSSDVDVPRVAATIDSNGNVNTSTTFTGPYNTNNPRAVYSPNGTNFYLSGQGSATKVGSVYTDQGGLFTTTLGTTGSNNTTPIYTAVSTRDVLAYGGNLYYSADQNSNKKGTQTGIFEYSGTPTSTEGSNTGTALFGATTIFSGTTLNLSPEDFVFANSTTLYVADTGAPKDGGLGDGGIQKWSLNAGTWSLDYTLRPSNLLSPAAVESGSNGESGFEDLALEVNGNNVDIYAVSYTSGSADAIANGLYDVVDSLSNLSSGVAGTETVNELEAAPGNNMPGETADYNFKGISFAPVPEPGTWGMAIAGLMMLLAFQRARRRS